MGSLGEGAVVKSRARTRARPGRAGAAGSGRSAARTRRPRAHVVEIQRSRLLAAAAGVVDDLGYSHTTVSHITARAGVSRRTFYDLFDNREDCLLAVFEDVVALIRGEVLAATGAEGLDWRERVRAGLWTILSFLDREPALARVCVVQALRGGARALERREQALAGLARALDEGRLEHTRNRECPPLTAEGLVGAVFGIVYGRLLRGEREPLTSLFGDLMAMIVLPYLGPAAAHGERRGTRTLSPGPRTLSPGPQGTGHPADSSMSANALLADLPMRLTYRTARVLEVLAEHSGASNRALADHAGITDQGQISKLLARLRRLGLIENTAGEGHAKGEANAWTLTPTGQRVTHAIHLPHTTTRTPRNDKPRPHPTTRTADRKA
jgi:AcrR family transcriptional regulator/DNA-binding MarR family transcriptional regulator